MVPDKAIPLCLRFWLIAAMAALVALAAAPSHAHGPVGRVSAGSSHCGSAAQAQPGPTAHPCVWSAPGTPDEEHCCCLHGPHEVASVPAAAPRPETGHPVAAALSRPTVADLGLRPLTQRPRPPPDDAPPAHLLPLQTIVLLT